MLEAAACGALLFPGLFFTFRTVLTSALTHWTEADVTSVSVRLVSAIHAILATAAGAVVVTSCRDVMHDSHWLANGFVCLGAPYMVYDILAMYLSHFQAQRVKGHSSAAQGHSLQTVRCFLKKEFLLVLHHLTLLLVFMPVALFLRRGLGDFFVGCLFLTELSSPFVSLGKILIQLRLDHTRLHRINGVLVLLSFFTCRVLLFPFMYLAYGRQVGLPLLSVPAHLPLHCNLGNALILAPQIYWFVLLLKKAQRLYLRQRSGGGAKAD